MKIPSPTIDATLIRALADYETSKQLIAKLNVPVEHFRRLEDRSVLKSSLYSARIEGNVLDESTFHHSKDELAKREIFNLIDAIEFVKRIPHHSALTLDTIRHLHALTLKDLSADAGHFRMQQNAIFDQSGHVRYLPPPPQTAREHMQELVDYCNRPVEFPIITALIAHLLFEKIHPFVDGNGRVGRLLITMTLKAQGEQFPVVVPFERYLENHREQYYRHIDTGVQDSSGYLLFMLDALRSELDVLRIELETPQTDKFVYLPLRQEEIHHIVSDHPYITMDGLRRRFMGVPVRTLRYDVAQLVKKGVIKKIGSTKGSCYLKNSR